MSERHCAIFIVLATYTSGSCGYRVGFNYKS